MADPVERLKNLNNAENHNVLQRLVTLACLTIICRKIIIII